ncbi:MAG: TIGR00730 family Rossman fold protein [Pseudomonadota bacterium]
MTVAKSICVYCGSSNRGPKSHRQAAARLGQLIAGAGIELVFGGGRVGLMGVIADAALKAGGRVTGIIPEHLIKAEVGHGRVSELVVVDSMHARKETMFRRADGFVILPGGPGTLDETFEILTWKLLGLHDKPVVIVSLGDYWRPLLVLIDRMVARRYAQPGFRDMFQVVARVEEALPAIARAPEPRFAPAIRRL